MGGLLNGSRSPSTWRIFDRPRAQGTSPEEARQLEGRFGTNHRSFSQGPWGILREG
jgi:hypothetical protein